MNLIHALTAVSPVGLIALKATVALLLALALVAAARRARASVRHLLLAALFIFLLLLPFVTRFAPARLIEVPATVAAPAGVRDLPPARVATETPRGQAVSNMPVERSIDWMTGARNLYLAGVALMLLSLATGVWRLRRVAETGEVWLEGTALMNAIAHESGIRRAVLVVLSRDTAVPLTFGFRRSTIVLPYEATEWPDDELRRAIRHELEHVRREDWVLQLGARAACAVYWPHPLVWVAWRRFCFEAERACDDAVLGSTGNAGDYAGQLVSLARSLKRGPGLPALGMASRSRLAQRVDALLDSSLRRGPHGGVATAVAVAVTLAIVVTVAPARLVGAAEYDRGAKRYASTYDGMEGAVREGVGGALAEAFVKSAESGRMDDVARLISAGMDVNTISRGDGTALIGAARGGQLEVALLLLDNGADVNLASPGDGNPLIMAAASGHPNIVRLLLERGADVDRVVEGDENALIQAAWNGHAEVVAILIGHGADVNARVVADGREVRTPLRMASRGGHRHIERMLLAAGARE